MQFLVDKTSNRVKTTSHNFRLYIGKLIIRVKTQKNGDLKNGDSSIRLQEQM